MNRYIFLSILLLSPFLSLLSQTNISGNFNTDSTLTLANSPYIVTADIIVAPGATLTIEPGVEILFDDNTRLGMRGNLVAIGLDTAIITFSSNNPSPSSGIWKGIVVSGTVDMEFVHGEYAELFLKLYDGGTNVTEIESSVFTRNDTSIYFDGTSPDSLRITRCLIEHSRVGVFADSNTVIRNAIFRLNDWGLQGNRIAVANSTFRANGWGALLERGRVSHCLFDDNSVMGMGEWGSSIGNSDFMNNEVGLATRLTPGSFIKLNEFRGNRIGVQVGPNINNSSTAVFADNAICDNTDFNVEVLSNPGLLIDLTNNCWCLTDSADIAATIYDFNDDTTVAEVEFMANIDTVTCLNDRVYPGDANYDQIADVFDIFPIGLKYGSTGPIRPNATTQWIGQPAPNWNDTLPNGVDIKHTDCNGDGIIDVFDIGPILTNFGNIHFSQKTTEENGIPLALALPTNTYNPGDTVVFPVNFGTMSIPATNIYALAFEVSYDTSLIEPNSISVDFINSWLGDEGINMVTLVHDNFDAGKLSIGLTRTDQVGQTGFGLIADVTVVLDEDIAKQVIPLTFTFIDAQAIEPDATDIPVKSEDGEGAVQTTSLEELIGDRVITYPNPAMTILIAEYPPQLVERMSLLSITGQELTDVPPTLSGKSVVDVSELVSGMYLLRIETHLGTLMRKILVE